MYPDELYFQGGDPGPKIDVTQASAGDQLRIEHIEIKSREFPWDAKTILDMIRDKDVCVVKVSKDYKCLGYLAYTVDADDIQVLRVAVIPDEHIHFLLQAMLDTITLSPGTNRRANVSLDWPEHDPNHIIPVTLLNAGFAVTGLEPKMFYGYGEWWDGIQLEKQF